MSGSEGNGRPLLEVEDLVVRYRVAARVSAARSCAGRSSTSMRCPASRSRSHAVEMVALVGESGCGKTTTARRSCGSCGRTGRRPLRRRRRHEPRAGRPPARCAGGCRSSTRIRTSRSTRASGVDDRRRAARHPRDRTAPSGRDAVAHALEQVGLAPAELFADRFPHELSGGQRQRVAIAASLVLEPTLLVADEPVSMLDVSVRAGDPRRSSTSSATRVGVLMITHDLSTAARFADRIASCTSAGSSRRGRREDVIENPQHPYTKALLSVVPRRDPRQRAPPRS